MPDWISGEGVSTGTPRNKLSIATANESKQQLNSFIIYDLDSIARVNERKKEEKKSEINKNVKKCTAEARSRAV